VPAPLEGLVTPWTITRIVENFFCSVLLLMTHARPRSGPFHLVSSGGPCSGRFDLAGSSVRVPTACIGAATSTATTSSPPACTQSCSNAPSDASAENTCRIPSADTLASVPAVPGAWLFSSVLRAGLDFPEQVRDLGWGSWEGLLPESSSLGEDSFSSPRRLPSVWDLADRLTLSPESPRPGASARLGAQATSAINILRSAAPLEWTSSPLARGALAPFGPPRWPLSRPTPTMSSSRSPPHSVL